MYLQYYTEKSCFGGGKGVYMYFIKWNPLPHAGKCFLSVFSLLEVLKYDLHMAKNMAHYPFTDYGPLQKVS